VTFSGPATVNGSGVIFYLTDDAKINTDGGGGMVSNIQLSAPTSGPYAGILIYQDPDDSKNARIGGDNNSYFDGALYLPEGQITFFGNAGGTGFNVAVVVADSIALGGNAIVNLQGSAGLPTGVNLIKNATLVE
jgi:hypothetical protein